MTKSVDGLVSPVFQSRRTKDFFITNMVSRGLYRQCAGFFLRT